MQLIIVLIAVAVIGLAAFVAAGRFGEQADPVRDVYRPPLGDDERVTADDLKDVRFGVTPMGYEMAEVDEWMARMARELELRDAALHTADRAPAEQAAEPSDEGTPRGGARDAE
ncbi:DivIVA domain-containing protein [Granulicoccus sp. GXG6511]|uniref:DivIVA domain-containing protein n=1 Tax=Granulicoccus sp. GXG6511 TaxID=3381351 RepID=UPI003D7E9E00